MTGEVQVDWLGRPVRRRASPLPGLTGGVDWLGHARRRFPSSLPPGDRPDVPEPDVRRAR